MKRGGMAGWAALAAGLLAAGCAHRPSVVGTWSGTTTSARGISVKSTWQLTGDGKNTLTVEALNGPFAHTAVVATGTYSVDGNSLTQTISSMSEGARTRTVDPPKATAYQFTLDGDTLTVSGGGLPQPQVLTRGGA